MNDKFRVSFHQPPQLPQGFRRRGALQAFWPPAAATLQQLHRCFLWCYQRSHTAPRYPLKEFISCESTNRELETWNLLYSQIRFRPERHHQLLGRPAELRLLRQGCAFRGQGVEPQRGLFRLDLPPP